VAAGEGGRLDFFEEQEMARQRKLSRQRERRRRRRPEGGLAVEFSVEGTGGVEELAGRRSWRGRVGRRRASSGRTAGEGTELRISFWWTAVWR